MLFIIPQVRGGGAERVQINIMNSLDYKKYDVTFVITSSDTAPEELNSKIKVEILHKKNAYRAFPSLLRLYILLKPHYVFTTSATLAYYLPILKIFHYSKVIVRIAVPPSEIIHTSFKAKVTKFIASITYRWVNQFIAQTEFMKQDFIKHYSYINPNAIIVVPNLIDKNFMESQSRKKLPANYSTFFKSDHIYLIAVGALYSVKGFDVLISAMSLLTKETLKKCKLIILGEERYEIGYKQYLQSLIDNLDLTKNISLAGHVSNPYPFFIRSDIFVLSSRTEGFPNVVLEALSLGLPVIATRCVDFGGVINSQNGCIVNVESPVEIAKCIERFILFKRKPVNFRHNNFNYESVFI